MKSEEKSARLRRCLQSSVFSLQPACGASDALASLFVTRIRYIAYRVHPHPLCRVRATDRKGRHAGFAGLNPEAASPSIRAGIEPDAALKIINLAVDELRRNHVCDGGR